MKRNCPYCSKPTSAKAAKCAHCGRSTREMIKRDGRHAIACPRCDSATDVARLGKVELDLCRACRGLWFDRAELASFREESTEALLNAQLGELLRELGARVSRPQDEAAYLACPVCAGRMLRTNYAAVSGIILHRCMQHGTWADHQAALRFVELIGSGEEAHLLELEAQRKERDLQRQLSRIEATQRAHATRIRDIDIRSRVHLALDAFDLV